MNFLSIIERGNLRGFSHIFLKNDSLDSFTNFSQDFGRLFVTFPRISSIIVTLRIIFFVNFRDSKVCFTYLIDFIMSIVCGWDFFVYKIQCSLLFLLNPRHQTFMLERKLRRRRNYLHGVLCQLIL